MTLTTSDVDTTGGPFTTMLRGTLDDVVWPTGMAALPALTSLSGGIATQVHHWLAERTRTQPYGCTGVKFEKTSQIALPTAVRAIDVPDDVEIKDQFRFPVAVRVRP